MAKTVTITREKLYKEIWEEPAMKVAERYGISGSMLARICTALNVPRPALGYWAKVKHGHKVTKQKLPKLQEGQKESWTVHGPRRGEQSYFRKKRAKGDVSDYTIEEKQILFAKSVEHRFVKATRKALKGKKPNYDGYVSAAYDCQHVRVETSPELIERALTIANKLLLLCENMNIQVHCPIDKNPIRESRYYSQNPSGRIVLLWEGEELSLRIREPRKRHLVKEQKYSWRDYKYTFSGELELTVGQSSQRDKKTVKIEDVLVSMARKALDELKANRARTLRREAEERYREFIREYTNCWQKQKRCEENALKELLEQADTYAQAQQLRSYVEACEKRLATNTQLGEEESANDRLKVAWMRSRLEMIDPFEKSDKPWNSIPLSVAEGAEPEDSRRW